MRVISAAGELREELQRLKAERALQPAPERAAELLRRTQQVEAVLAGATVAAIEPAPDGRVLFGAWVELEDGAQTSFRIVGPDEADARAHRLGASAPLARALLGKRAGDEVSVELPRGAASFTVRSVRYRP